MELRHLHYFVTVARERNFTRAAAKLHIAQPPLSRQVQQLEDELGVELLERNCRPIRLTEAGRLVFEQATQVLERVDDIKQMIRRLQSTARHVTIGFVGSTLYGYLPDVIRAYRAARPDAELNLVELTTLEQINALKEGRIDVGFGRIPLEDPAIDRVLLRNERLCVALAPDHPLLQTSGPLWLADFAEEPLIVYPKAPRPSYADQVLALYRSQGLKPAALHEVKELQTALGLVAAQSGVCLVPASVERLRRDNVAYRPLRDDAAFSPILMSTRKGDRSPEIALILKLIRQIYARQKLTFGA
jgi:DNA-binding transcriptional LysR family regulator